MKVPFFADRLPSLDMQAAWPMGTCVTHRGGQSAAGSISTLKFSCGNVVTVAVDCVAVQSHRTVAPGWKSFTSPGVGFPHPSPTELNAASSWLVVSRAHGSGGTASDPDEDGADPDWDEHA